MKLSSSAVLFTLALAAGCQSTGPSTQAQHHSGFLGNYSQLKPAPDREGVELYVDKSTDYRPAVGGGERVKGATRGALGGAAIGAITGDAGKGAGVGAVVGTMAGGHSARQKQAARNQQVQGQQSQAIDTYYRAYAACMSGRGYTVS